MLSIRLARFGKKKQPSYRIVVCQKHKDPLGDYIESLGVVNYFGGEKTVELKKDRAEYWLSVGAQPTDTVYNILIDNGLLKGKKLKPSGIKPHKKKASEEKTETQEPAAADKKSEEESQAKAAKSKEEENEPEKQPDNK